MLAYYVPAFLLLLIGCQPAGLKENLLEKMFFFGHCPNGSVMCTCVGVVYDNDIINNRIIFFFSCCNITRTLNKEIADSAQTEYCSTFQCLSISSRPTTLTTGPPGLPGPPGPLNQTTLTTLTNPTDQNICQDKCRIRIV